jgi:hypothetical protein
MTETLTKTPTPTGFPPLTLNRVLDEGYGPGAWYGADLRTATDGLTAKAAFARPAPGRHNVAEIALHHAYWATQLAAKLTGAAPPQFPLDGEDWFDLNDESRLSWKAVRATLEEAQARLSKAVRSTSSPLSEAERFDIAIGITGHAAYHAGQIQLVKVLVSGQ